MNQPKINPFLLGALIITLGIGAAYISNNQKRPSMMPPASPQTQTNTGTPSKNTTPTKNPTGVKASTSVNGYYQLN